MLFEKKNGFVLWCVSESPHLHEYCKYFLFSQSRRRDYFSIHVLDVIKPVVILSTIFHFINKLIEVIFKNSREQFDID
jgi:hypothetical protein